MKYVIFDIDGTLTNTTKVDDQCYIEAFESVFKTAIRDIQWSQLQNVTDWGITEELIQLKLNRVTTQADIQSLKSIFISKIKEAFKSNKSNFEEITGAREFYDIVTKQTQLNIGIATGGWEETANVKLDAIGINPNTATYSNSNYFKERENITLDVINKLNSRNSKKPEEIIYFGDGEWDYKTCQKLGIRFIGIDSSNNGKLRNIGAKEVYQNFKDSESILKAILNGR